MPETCSECRYAIPNGGPEVECRRYAPHPIPHGPSSSDQTRKVRFVYPVHPGTEIACGEFKARPTT